MKIYCCENYEEMSAKGANVIAEVVKSTENCVLGLATGSSPVGIYKNLVKMFNDGELTFKKCRSVNLDEYCGIDKQNDQSYAYFMNENLFKHVDLPESHLPNGLNANAQEECKRYDAQIESMGGIDLQLLGIGINGHIGFNEPSDSFIMETHKVELEESTIKANARFFNSIDEVPTTAYTMGMGPILNAKKVLLIASGANKADALYGMIFGEVTPQMPASVLQQAKGEVIVVADRAALSKVIERDASVISK